MDYKNKFLKYQQKYQNLLHKSGGVNLSINNLISSPYDVLEPSLFKNDPYRPTINNNIESFLPPVQETRPLTTGNFLPPIQSRRPPVAANFSHMRLMPQYQTPIRPVRFYQSAPFYLINTPIIQERPSPPKVLVKKINGISSLQYFDFKHNNKPYKIMLCEKLDYYCYNDYFCEANCKPSNKCYNILELTKAYTKTKCLDLFTLFPLDKRIKDLDLGKLEITGGSTSIDNTLFRYIDTLFKNNLKGIFKNDNNIPLTPLEISRISTEADYKTYFEKSCKFKSDLFKPEILKDIYEYIMDPAKKSIITNYSTNTKNNIIKYLNHSVKISDLNINLNNIRHHLSDIRIIQNENRQLGTPLFILPEILIRTNLNNRINLISSNLDLYKTSIRINYTYDTDKTIISNNIKNLLFYLCDYKNRSTEYTAGETLYNGLHNVFKTNYSSITFNQDDIMREFRKIIKKQLNKSIFFSDLDNFFEKFREAFKDTLDENELDLPDQVNKEYIYYYNIEMGFFITDLYVIARMFKKEFDPQKNKKNNKCDQNKYFKDIVYLGSKSNNRLISKFIQKYFNETPKINSNNSSKKGCVEFDSPVEFFKN